MNLREALTVQLQRELDAATVQADTLFGAYLAAKQAVEDAQSRKFRLQDQLRAAQRAEGRAGVSCGGDTYKHALECAMQTRRDLILGVAEDLGVTYVAYDRKEDENLPRGEIQAALEAGELTQAEIVAAFAKGLREAL